MRVDLGRALITLSLFGIFGLHVSAALSDEPQAGTETIQKDSQGHYLSSDAAIQVYLGGDEDFLEIRWNIASGYRLYLDPSYATDADGQLSCNWDGILADEFVPRYGQIRTARVWASLKCKRPIRGKAVKTLLISYAGGSIDSYLFEPVKAWLEQAPKVRYYTGVTLSDLDLLYGLLNPAFKHGGVLLQSVAAGSPAERAGLQKGDIITAVNGMPVRSARQFVTQIQDASSTKMEVEPQVYRRDGGYTPMKLVLKRELYKGQSYSSNNAKKDDARP